MKLSIVIPVYGVEKYIEQCISSLLVPSCNDYEIVIVNDGTKDKSMDIIHEKYSDSRIRILQQENAGLSAARNRGMLEAQGEYIWFFDSDDWAETQHIQEIINSLDEIDALFLSFHYMNYMDDNTETVVGLEVTETTGINLACTDTPQCAPYYIWKKDILVTNNLSFKEGLLHEDALFTPKALLHINKIKGYGNPVYHHRMHEGSITHVIKPKRICDLLYIIKEHLNTTETLPSNIKYKWGICIANIANQVLYLSQKCSDNPTKEEVKEYFNQNWQLIRYLIHARKKNTQIMGLLSILSFGNVWTIYKILYKLRY